MPPQAAQHAIRKSLIYPLRRFAPQLKRRTLGSSVRQPIVERLRWYPGSVPRRFWWRSRGRPAPVGRPALPSVRERTKAIQRCTARLRSLEAEHLSRAPWSSRAGRPGDRAATGFPGGWSAASGVSRERLHPNKRLKLSAPRAPAGGATSAAGHAIRKSLISSAAAVRAAA